MVKTNKETAKSNSKSKILAFGIVTVGVLAFGAWAWMQFSSTTKNYAEETVKPLEKALIDAGAIKKCTISDSGSGPDNKKPGYSATFATNFPKDEAIKIAQSAARSYGYELEFKQSPMITLLGTLTIRANRAHIKA